MSVISTLQLHVRTVCLKFGHINTEKVKFHYQYFSSCCMSMMAAFIDRHIIYIFAANFSWEYLLEGMTIFFPPIFPALKIALITI